ncbi:MAG: hypothetical protein KAW12_31125 [Candidatus Aminicenantes bacterium]|nr:hypothetical protein [Candidatus Aminicenantes bacterium]
MSKILMKEIKNDPDLEGYTLANLPLLKELKELCQAAPVSVCIERAKLITEYMKDPDDPYESPELIRAKAVKNYMSNREAIFHTGSRIAGSSTSKELGAPVFPELGTGLSIWPELDTISTRKANPQLLTKEEAKILNFDVFPFWLDSTILEATRHRAKKENDQEVLDGITLFERVVFFIAAKTGCISHTTPYYETVLEKGLNGMIEEADKKIEELDKVTEKAKIDFYKAMQISMQGIIDYAANLSKKAAELAEEETSADKKENLLAMAEVCANVPAKPAGSFREAVNSLWICHVGVLGENINMAMGPGRLDQVLYPYFKKDVEKNKVTIPEALTLIGSLWIKIADNTNLVPETSEKLFGGAGSVPAVTLGGVDMDGKDAVNDLTYLMLKVTELLAIKDPNVNARFHEDVNSKEYIDRVSRVIINTGAIPAMYNDKTNIDTLLNQYKGQDDTVTPEKLETYTKHARDYAVIGCVELGSAGREYSASSSLIVNLTAAMDMVFCGGQRPYLMPDMQIGPKTKLEDLKTFADFRQAFEAQAAAFIKKGIAFNEAMGQTYQEILPSPLMSAFFEGPWEKGMDLAFGGAVYNSSGTTHIGFADVCDSLNAVECAVYRDKKCTLEEMADALNNDFEGHDKLLDYLRNTENVPRYGMDDSAEENPIAVPNSQRMIDFLYELYQSHTNYRGGKYRPAYWTMTNHAGLGTIGRALPSGRRAGQLFSSGITPASQLAKDLTGVYNSVAKLNHKHIPGCVAFNMKYTREEDSGNGSSKKYRDNFRKMVEAYFKSGGMQVQFNVRNYQYLIDVMKNPAKDPHLIVRVSGYSAYFKDLNEPMKCELITRSQYNLESNQLDTLTVKLKYQGEGGIE